MLTIRFALPCSCAGLCEYHGGRSGYCCIKLSEKLLQFRSRKELIETLLVREVSGFVSLLGNLLFETALEPNANFA
jgi:hypothetical protein